MGKEKVCLVVDTGSNMDLKVEGGESARNMMIQTAQLFVQQKMINAKGDEVGLILVGTEGTDNELADPDGGYANIVTASGLGKSTLELYNAVTDIRESTATGDILDAIVLAAYLLDQKATKVTRRVVVMTNNRARVSEVEQLGEIIEKLTAMPCHVDVIGVGLSGDSSSGEAEDTLRKLTVATGGVLYSATTAIDLLSQSTACYEKPYVRFAGDLVIGEEVKLPVAVYARTQKKALPTLSKTSLPGLESGSRTAKVKRDLTYKKPSDLNTVVEPEEQSRAYPYGRDLVPFLDVDEEAMKYHCSKELLVLGFTAAANVRRTTYVGECDVLVPKHSSQLAWNGISALAEALLQKNEVIICRYVKGRTQPLLAVLKPCGVTRAGETRVPSSLERENLRKGKVPSSSDPNDILCYGFAVNQLPFAEDFRDFEFEEFSNSKHAPSDSQLGAAEDVIRSMDLMNVDVGGGHATEAFKVGRVVDPVLHSFYHVVHKRALDESAEVEPLPEGFKKSLNPPEVVLRRARSALESFKGKFPFKAAELGKKKAQQWGELEEKDREQGDAKRQRVDVEAFGKEEVTAVGTVRPAQDFDDLMRQGKVEQAMKGMEVVIERFIREAGDYDKAIECLKHYRSGAIKAFEPSKFNDFLKKLKEEFKMKPIWKSIKDKQISLIHSDECNDDSLKVSQRDSQEFLDEPVAREAAPVQESVPDMDLDLDEME